MWTGCLTALITPFADGAIDYPALERLVETQIAAGVQGLVPCGSTGESATLTHDEHADVVRAVVEVTKKRVPVIAGTGSNATAEAITLTRRAEAAGADGALLISPYYNKPTQEGLYRHFMAVADATTLPVVLYNVPPRTACDMLPATVARLSAHERIVGIKEACGNPERVGDLAGVVPDEFVILSGEDAQTLRMMELGARGTISVTANVVPGLMAEFCAAFLAGDRAKAGALDARLQPLHKALFVEPNPQPAKWALHEMGRADTGIRLPLIELSEAARPALLRCLKEIGAIV